MDRRKALITIALAPALLAARPGDPPGPPGGEGLLEELVRSWQDTLSALGEYRESLARLLAVREAERDRAAERAQRSAELHAAGLISGRERETAEGERMEATRVVEETRERLAEADALAREARASLDLAKAPPPGPGERREVAGVIRHGGSVRWSPADVSRVETFFRARFQRPLPITAFGQTSLHDRLGFDHREAIDVGVHPDSDEGRALLAYLRDRGIAFLAFREPVRGAATGAHIHIGDPSPLRPTGRRAP